MSVHDAMLGSDALRSLTQRLQQSQTRLKLVHAALPESLRPHVKSGGLDHEAWTLLADSAAMGAKLRQLVPTFDAAIVAAGMKPIPIRIRVQQR
mgnify:CR=1 FL=1